ncbi:MAG: ABC transporter permease, partial [Armatimonadota bacterium]
MEAWGGMGGWLAIGALYRKELRQILRSAGALAIENAWLVIVLAIAALTALVGTAAWSPSWRVGSTAFWVIMSVQAVAVAVVIPTFAASLVTGEHGSNTWDVLRSAPITPRQVIYGKLLAASAVHI